MNTQVLYADTNDDLQLKMLGYHHDHCYWMYVGKTKNAPDRYKELITENKEYCFIFEEAEPSQHRLEGRG